MQKTIKNSPSQMTVITKELANDDGHIKTMRKEKKKYASQKSPIISNEPMGLPVDISQLPAFFVFDKRLNVGNLEGGRKE